MIRVYLIRHAIAFERDRKRWPDDRDRPLSPEGGKKFRKGAAGLGSMVDSVECVLTSPLVRARQTAEILERVAGWPHAIEAPELAPGHGADRVLELVRGRGVRSIALVGHEPDLGQLLAASIGAASPLALKKGAAVCLSFDQSVGRGTAQLAWLMTPRLLRQLAEV